MADRDDTHPAHHFQPRRQRRDHPAEGDEAADHIVSGGHVIDYLKVAAARSKSGNARRAGGNRPGETYNVAFSKWLDQHPTARRRQAEPGRRPVVPRTNELAPRREEPRDPRHRGTANASRCAPCGAGWTLGRRTPPPSQPLCTPLRPPPRPKISPSIASSGR